MLFEDGSAIGFDFAEGDRLMAGPLQTKSKPANPAE
jgi:hypothetical protein